MNKKYSLSNRKVPGLSFSHNLDDMRELQSWINGYGIRTANTRIDRYIRYLEKVVEHDTDFETQIFDDPEENPFKSPTDRIMYVLREVHELGWIHRGLKSYRPEGLSEKLKLIVGGSDFAALDLNSLSRNIQFELRIASYFCQDGFIVDLSQRTDIIASKKRETFYVECKRVGSKKKLQPRLREVKKQLRSRIPQSTYRQKYYGIAAIDITKVAFDHNGLTGGITQEINRDMIQEKLVSVGTLISKYNWAPTAKNVLLTWLQIHIPAMTIYPVQLLTRFSSCFMENPKMSGRHLRAFRRLKHTLEISCNRDSREITYDHLKHREKVFFPQGTVIGWDMELLEGLVENWVLPPKEPDSIVLELALSDRKLEFIFFELEIVVESLSKSEIAKFQKDKETALVELAVLLYYLRHPYEEDEN